MTKWEPAREGEIAVVTVHIVLCRSCALLTRSPEPSLDQRTPESGASAPSRPTSAETCRYFCRQELVHDSARGKLAVCLMIVGSLICSSVSFATRCTGTNARALHASTSATALLAPVSACRLGEQPGVYFSHPSDLVFSLRASRSSILISLG